MGFSTQNFETFLEDLKRVLAAVAEITGDAEAAKQYVVSHPLPPFQGKTAVALVAEGRVDDVMRFFVSLESGFVG